MLDVNDRVIAFATAVLHGDDEHKTWLLQAAHAFVKGQPLPSPRGKGTATPSPSPEPQDVRAEKLAKELAEWGFIARPAATSHKLHELITPALAQSDAQPVVWQEAMHNLIALARPHFSDDTQMLALRQAEEALAAANAAQPMENVREKVHCLISELLAGLSPEASPFNEGVRAATKWLGERLFTLDPAPHRPDASEAAEREALNEALRFLDKIEHEASAQYATLAARKICDVLEAPDASGLIEAAEWHDEQAKRCSLSDSRIVRARTLFHQDSARQLRSRAADRSAPRSDKGGA